MLPDIEVKSELDLGEPSQELLQWAKDNIREDPDTRCQMIEDFRDMIYSRGDCTPQRTDDAFLLRFLRSRKFSLEGAYKLFLGYHDFREENPNFIEGVDFDILEKVGECDIISVLPYKDQTGRGILVYKPGKWDPETFSADEVLSATLLIAEIAVLQECAQIFGGICIVDCENVSMKHIMHLSPSVLSKILRLILNTHPVRLEAMHIVNNSRLVEVPFNMFKPFLVDKMKERLFFHGYDRESLHKHIDPKRLPDIYGGAQPSDNTHRDWIRGFRKNPKLLKEIDSLGYPVSKYLK